MYITAELKQTIGLKISQNMQQSLKVLQMSSTELIDFYRDKYETNLLLHLDFNEEQLSIIKGSKLKPLTTSISKQNSNLRGAMSEFNFKMPDKINIDQFFCEQIPSNNPLSNTEIALFRYLVKNLNSHGYLDVEIDTIAELFNMPSEQVLEVLYFLQGLEPKGVGARTLQECLLLQCRENSLAEKMILDYLPLIGKRDLKKIAFECNESLTDVEGAFDFIISLNPKPLQHFQPLQNIYITPDVTVLKVANQWEIDINKRHLPKITIDDFYLDMLHTSDGDTKKYLKKHYTEAKILLQGLEQREQTLYQLIDAIIEFQGEHFEMGLTSLKPMRLADIAKLMNMHESTVSRAANNKYIQTPYGSYVLTSLFTKGITNEDGNVTAVSQIKERIKTLINAEDTLKPYSDQMIVEILEKEQINLSRRTVAKYREEMNIRSSTKRVKYI